MKHCNSCKETKPLDKFGRRARTKDGLEHFCKKCYNALRGKWRRENPEKAQTQYTPLEKFVIYLKSKYKMTIEQFDEMLLNQGGMCAICDQEAELKVDHDHETGKVRALLCHSCNVGIGHLRDSIELIAKAGDYLKKHKSL